MINSSAIIIRQDCWITVNWMADILHMYHGSVFTIVHNHLNIRHICARWTQRLQMPEQKLMQIDVYWELQNLIIDHGEAYLNFIIVGDERWLHHYNPKNKQTTTVKKISLSLMPKKARVVQSAWNALITMEWLTSMKCPRHTYNNYWNMTIAKPFQQEYPELQPFCWHQYHDNTYRHIASVIAQHLADKTLNVCHHNLHTFRTMLHVTFFCSLTWNQSCGTSVFTPQWPATLIKVDAVLKTM